MPERGRTKGLRQLPQLSTTNNSQNNQTIRIQPSGLHSTPTNRGARPNSRGAKTSAPTRPSKLHKRVHNNSRRSGSEGGTPVSVQLERRAFDRSDHIHDGVKEKSLKKNASSPRPRTTFTPTDIAANGHQKPRIYKTNYMPQGSWASQCSRLRQRTIARRRQRANQ